MEGEKKPAGKFAAKLKANAKRIVVWCVAVLILGVGLAAALVGVHYTSLVEPEDVVTLPIATLPSDLRVVVDNPAGYIAHPDTVLTDDGKILVMYPLGHGKGEIAMRTSDDFGASWSDRVSGLPSSWEDSQETPTLYNLHFTDGRTRLVLISGCPYWPATSYKADGFNFSYSDDNGATWSEFQKFHSPYDAIVAMSSLTQLRDENGQPVDAWMGLFHDHKFNVYKTVLTFDENDNAVWSEPVGLFAASDNDNAELAAKYGMCEVEVIRVEGTGTADDGALILLGRANNRVSNSLIAVSRDEGATWSALKELPYELCGDRHKAEYDAVTGRVLVSYRQMIPVLHSAISPYKTIGNGWYAWVGTFADLLSYADDDPSNDSAGDLLIELGKTDYFAKPYDRVLDNGYSGVVVKDGVFNVVGYGCFDATSLFPYIISLTFNLGDVLRANGIAV